LAEEITDRIMRRNSFHGSGLSHNINQQPTWLDILGQIDNAHGPKRAVHGEST